MPPVANTLPISETLTADSEAHVSEILKSANESLTAVYPIGGGTSLDYGLPAKIDGLGLQLTGLDRVVDYPARDMTITVGSGITIKHLQQALSPEKQRLPIDTPAAHRATLGGLIASNHSGPLRYGHGTMRDHVIGIRAVDGRGNDFAAGGRVVKNVAGYDFCKLLTGSLGTLGIITEVTLKLKPIPAEKAFICCCPQDLDHTDRLLVALIDSQTNPVSVEVLAGAEWNDVAELGTSACGWIVVGFEGTAVEVDWMTRKLESEWQDLGAEGTALRDDDYAALNQKLIDFPADQDAVWVLKLTCVPSGVTRSIKVLQATNDPVSIQAHAGNGIVIAKYAEIPGEGMSRVMSRLKATTALAHGSVTTLSNPSGNEMTHHSVWGTADVPFDLMKRVKDAFDPNNILNPRRFVY